MNQRQVQLATRLGEVRRTLAIDRIGALTFQFRRIHRGECRRVYHYIGIAFGHQFTDAAGMRHIGDLTTATLNQKG